MFPLLTVQGGFVHDMRFNFENCQFQIIQAITVLKINAHIYTLLPSSITKSYKTLVASIKIHKSQLLLFIWIADQSLAFL